MTETPIAEIPVFFKAGTNHLFGIISMPDKEPTSGVIVLSGGGTPTSVNRNRLSVRLCRMLASGGVAAMRFDYHGVGESEGIVEYFRLDEPFVEDLESAIDVLRSQGIGQLSLIGMCFGARTALATAPRIGDLGAVVLVAPPLRDFEMTEEGITRIAEHQTIRQALRRGLRPAVLRGLAERERRELYFAFLRAKTKALLARRAAGGGELSWVSTNFLEPLAATLQAGAKVLFVYGTDDYYYEEFTQAKAGRLGTILSNAGARTRVVELSGAIHGFTNLEVQDRFLDAIEKLLPDIARAPADAPPAAGGPGIWTSL